MGATVKFCISLQENEWPFGNNWVHVLSGSLDTHSTWHENFICLEDFDVESDEGQISNFCEFCNLSSIKRVNMF